MKNIMKKQSGFTLIELVIVIIILGILAATAVPKFVDLQGDARASAMRGMKGALEGAATLTYSKAAIDGHETDDGTGGFDVANVDIVFGYPAGTVNALEEAVSLDTLDWSISAASGTAIISAFSGPANCQVTYVQAVDSASRPTITVTDNGC